MKREEILSRIKSSLEPKNKIKGSNSMGVSESYYNPYYLIGKCFEESELIAMNEKELNLIVRLADFSSEVFY